MTAPLPRAWRELVHRVNDRAFGAPGVRDPENQCEDFKPGFSPVNGSCDSDGHYLCEEDRCVHLRWCGCGNRRATHCECVLGGAS